MATLWTTSFPGWVRAPRSVPREFGGGRQVELVWLTAASLRPGCPLVSVSSADGGVGRSTLVAALGGLLALACPQPVLAVDLTGRAWGGLADRVGRRNGASVWDAASDVDRLTSRQAVERLVQHGPTGLHTLVGEREMTSRRRPPSGDEMTRLVARLQKLYPLALLDLPPADTKFAWTALTWGSAPVLVARATQDSLRHSMRLVAQLRAVGLGAMADHVVLVVMETSARVPGEVKAAERQARGVVGEVVRVPYDRNLARPDPVDPRRLRGATRGALVDVAAAVLRLCPADPQAAATVVDPPGTWPNVFQGEESG